MFVQLLVFNPLEEALYQGSVGENFNPQKHYEAQYDNCIWKDIR